MRAARGASVSIAFCILILRAGSSFASPCNGDCNVDAVTEVGEVVRCIVIALGIGSPDECPACDQNDDGAVTIDEMVVGVQRSLGDCQASFAEAAAGVSSSAMDAANALQVLNFGAIANAPTASGSGAGAIGCIRCSGGGEVTDYSCLSDNERSVMTAVLDSCSDGTTTRSGNVRFEIDDPAFCVSCRVALGSTGAQTLGSYTEVAAGGPNLAVEKSLTEAFTVTGAGCRGPGRPDRVSRLDGELRISTATSDALFTYAGLTGIVTSQRVIQRLCTITTTLGGTFQVRDFLNGRTFVQSSTDFQTVETTDSDGLRRIELNTTRGGFLDVDCLGGPVSLTATQALVFPPGAGCASEGRLEFRFPSGERSAVAATDGGGLAFDYDHDGVADRRADSCDDPSLSQCHVPLQGSVLAKSDFARDTDGWLAIGDASAPEFRREGGNPGGHVCATDLQRGDIWYWSAPAAFLGNVSAAYRGRLRFDLRQLVITAPIFRIDLVLQGGGLRLDSSLEDNPGGDWTSYAVPLVETAGWFNERTGQPATSAEMLTVLGSLEALLLRGEFNDGPDESCLDNFTLSASP